MTSRSEQPTERSPPAAHEGPVCGALSDRPRPPQLPAALPPHADGPPGVRPQRLPDPGQPGTAHPGAVRGQPTAGLPVRPHPASQGRAHAGIHTVSLSICIHVCMSVCLSVCLSIFCLCLSPLSLHLACHSLTFTMSVCLSHPLSISISPLSPPPSLSLTIYSQQVQLMKVLVFFHSFSQALWKTLRSPVDNIAHVAFRVLGKFGGGNRKMLREPQKVSAIHHNMH